MNSFYGTWIDQQNVIITISGSGTSATVTYSNGRGPFQSTINTSTSQITTNFTDDGGNKTGTLSNNNSQIDWDNDTVWQCYYVRKNAWNDNNNGQFTNVDGSYTDLYWYAKAVQVMQARPISDPTSWWFYAAIHGEYLLKPPPPNRAYLNWNKIAYIPSSAKLNTPPPQKTTDLFWNQCQHATWFFPPWHRGYLVALENILRGIITNQLNGPSSWALPYWNYLELSKNENIIPPAFTNLYPLLPDGTPNPLIVPERYGPQGNGNVYVEVGYDDDPNGVPEANDVCQWDTIYSGSDNNFYGGGETNSFNHGGGSGTGDLEGNPHNWVHVMVGGQQNSNMQSGLMAVPATAALDPIFYLHHANIDRMWTAWNVTGNNSNTDDPNWLNGPTAQGNRHFVMPTDSSGTPWYYTPTNVQATTNIPYNGNPYFYNYNNLSLTSFDNTPPQSLQGVLAVRMEKLGIANLQKSTPMANKNELVGASKGLLNLSGNELKTQVQLDKTSWNTVAKSLLKSSAPALPDEVYLLLEGVKGANDANFLAVFINDQFIKRVSLFGLHSASADESHGASGLTFKFNITNIVDDLHLDNNIDINSLNVSVKAKDNLSAGDDITIERIAIYRSGQ